MLTLCNNELSESLPIQLHALKFENDRLPNDSFLLCVAHCSEKRVFKALLQGYSIVGVKDQDLLQKVNRLRWRPRVLLLEVCPWVPRELLEVLERFQVGNEAFVRLRWRANDLENDCKLVVRREREPFTLLCRVLGR